MRFQPGSTIFVPGIGFAEVYRSDSLSAWVETERPGIAAYTSNQYLVQAQAEFWESFAPAPRPPHRMTIQEAAAAALAVQDACNLSGVAMTFTKVCEAVREDLHSTKSFDTPTFNRHPVIVLFLDKMADLAGLHDIFPHGPTENFGRSYDACKRLAQKLEGDSNA